MGRTGGDLSTQDPGLLATALLQADRADDRGRPSTHPSADVAEWTPRELRHSFVSLLSDSGVPLARISRLVGHSGTAVTEAVYRKQLRPVLEHGAIAMNDTFPTDEESA